MKYFQNNNDYYNQLYKKFICAYDRELYSQYSIHLENDLDNQLYHMLYGPLLIALEQHIELNLFRRL